MYSQNTLITSLPARCFCPQKSFVAVALLAVALFSSSTLTLQGAPAGMGPAGQLSLENGPAIPILACAMSIDAASTWMGGGGASVGKAVAGPIRFTKALDANSISLLRKIVTGKAYTSAKYTVVLGSDKEAATMVYEMTGLFITNLTQAGTGAAPLEELSFVYKTISWTFTEANGTVTSGNWDVTAGTAQ